MNRDELQLHTRVCAQNKNLLNLQHHCRRLRLQLLPRICTGVKERERERERVCVCAYLYARMREGVRACGYACMRAAQFSEQLRRKHECRLSSSLRWLSLVSCQLCPRVCCITRAQPSVLHNTLTAKRHDESSASVLSCAPSPQPVHTCASYKQGIHAAPSPTLCCAVWHCTDRMRALLYTMFSKKRYGVFTLCSCIIVIGHTYLTQATAQ